MSIILTRVCRIIDQISCAKETRFPLPGFSRRELRNFLANVILIHFAIHGINCDVNIHDSMHFSSSFHLLPLLGRPPTLLFFLLYRYTRIYMRSAAHIVWITCSWLVASRSARLASARHNRSQEHVLRYFDTERISKSCQRFTRYPHMHRRHSRHDYLIVFILMGSWNIEISLSCTNYTYLVLKHQRKSVQISHICAARIQFLLTPTKVKKNSRFLLSISSHTIISFARWNMSADCVKILERLWEFCIYLKCVYSLNLNHWNSHWLNQWKYINWWISALLWFHWWISERATWT